MENTNHFFPIRNNSNNIQKYCSTQADFASNILLAKMLHHEGTVHFLPIKSEQTQGQHNLWQRVPPFELFKVYHENDSLFFIPN